MTDRINKNEERLDSALLSIKKLSEAIEDFKQNQENIELVNKYYGSDSWFKDKEAYEKRRIPMIKAGVLSEDAVWNMLNDIKELVSEMQLIIDNYSKLNNK